MNILWLSHLIPYPPKGGVNQRSYNLIKEISKKHNVYIIAFSQKSQQPTKEIRDQSIEGLSELGKIIDVYTFDSDLSLFNKFILITKSIFTKDPYTINWLKKKGVGLKIQAAIEMNNIDLVHFDTISWAVYRHYVKDCKTVMNHHNVESHMMIRRVQKESNYFKKLYYFQEGIKLKYYEKQYCGDFHLNITCSKNDTNRLRSMLPNLYVETIPNGVDIGYFRQSGLVQEENSLIFAGGLSWYPNIAAMEFFANEVWPMLSQEVDGISMTVVGRNPPQWLLDFSKSNNNFKVTGFVDDVRPYIERASIYVCPINDGGGTKLKILDALAMGKAIVAHPIACEGIDVIEGESVMFAEKPVEYIEKIKLLNRDRMLRNKLGINGRRLIEEKYDYTNIGNKLNNLYMNL